MTFERVKDALTGELRPYDTIVTAQDNPEDWGMVYFRPYIRTFLEAVSKVFEVVLFTAACKEYADQIVNAIDPDNRLFHHRLYRDSCQEYTPDPSQPGAKIYIKDLRVLGRELKDVILIDNSLLCFSCQLDNGIVCNPFKGSSEDRELISILDVLGILNRSPTHDVRKFFRRMYGLSDIIREYSERGGRYGIQAIHHSALDEFLDTPTQSKRNPDPDHFISQKSTAMNTPVAKEARQSEKRYATSGIRTSGLHQFVDDETEAQKTAEQERHAGFRGYGIEFDQADYEPEAPPRSCCGTPQVAAPPIFINTILPSLEHTRTPIQTLYTSIVCNQNRSRFQ